MDEKSIIIEYAKGWNNLDIKYIYPHLAKNVSYSSQENYNQPVGIKDVSNYIKELFRKNREAPHDIFAEIGETQRYPMYQVNPQPCILLSFYKEQTPKALVLLDIDNSKIVNILVCSVAPHPSTAIRLDYYPV